MARSMAMAMATTEARTRVGDKGVAPCFGELACAQGRCVARLLPCGGPGKVGPHRPLLCAVGKRPSVYQSHDCAPPQHCCVFRMHQTVGP